MSQKEVLVSFVIPVYNTQKYLERCLTSVVKIQNRNIEIVIVDDGSTDQSNLIYTRYAKIDSRICVIKKENGGVSSARNRGVQFAKGKWITFIDSDDEIEPEIYDSVLSQLNDTSELWVLRMARCCCSESFRLANIKTYVEGKEEDIKMIQKGIFFPDIKAFRKLRRHGFDFSGPYAKFFQRKIIMENHLFFPEDLIFCEDCVFNFTYLNCVKKIEYTNECGYYYWQNNNSVKHKFEKGKGKEWMKTAEYVKNILKNDLIEYAQWGVRCYLYAMKLDWCHIDNHDSYLSRKKEGMQWRKREFVDEAFRNFKLSKIRWEAIPVAFCAKMKWFLLCDLMMKMKEKLCITFR